VGIIRIIIGLALLTYGLLTDGFSQTKRLLQGGHLDNELPGIVLSVIWKFTAGLAVAIGLYFLIRFLFQWSPGE
jgi:uncharacterized membrane protein YphA (DoxX/SURF4 family)